MLLAIDLKSSRIRWTWRGVKVDSSVTVLFFFVIVQDNSDGEGGRL